MKRLAIASALIAALALTATALASGGPSGKYKTKINSNKILHGGLDGTWVINFTPGKYSVTVNGRAKVHGTDTISGSIITLTDTGGSGRCVGHGKYKFKLSGNKLTFKKISEPSTSCVGREGVLTSGTFTKV